ncbi:MAG: hypothetical protein AB1546_14285 [bacterium]
MRFHTTSNIFILSVFLWVLTLSLQTSLHAYTDVENPFGINAHIYYDYNEAGRIAEMGVKWTRCDFNWSSIEREAKGSFDWWTMDTMVTVAHNHGIQILAVLGYSPSWATTAPQDAEQPDHWPPKNNEDYKDFVRAVVERYDGDGIDDMSGSFKVQYYELWNEPDIGFYMGTAEEYVQTLVAGYEGAKEADPNSVVLMGGLSRGGKDGDWIDRMLAAMKAATDTVTFDIANNHIYEDPDNVPARIQRFRNSFLNFGIDVPHWYTEGSKGATQPEHEPEQVKAVVKFFARYLANGVDKFFWYMWQYGPSDYGEGFFYPDGSRKQGYYAYQTMSSLVSPRYYDPSLKILTSELEQYGFTDPSGATSTLYLLMSSDGESHDLRLAYPAQAMDYITATGTATRITVEEDGLYSLTVSDMPFYLREVKEELTGPAIRYPSSNSVVGNPKINFTWDVYPDAIKYSLVLSRDPSFADFYTSRYDNIATATYQPDMTLTDGNWYARTIAFTPAFTEIYGPTIPFTVDTTPPPAPQIASFSPSNLLYFGSVQIVFPSPTDPDAVQYNIYRSDKLENLGDVVHSTVSSSDLSFIDRLGEDIDNKIYYYRISALDAAAPPNESEPSETYLAFLKLESPFYAGWNLMGFPGLAVLTAYTPLATYMEGFGWDNGQYDYYDGTDASLLDPAKGYWIYNDETTAQDNLIATGQLGNPKVQEFKLDTGWNLVPNPYPFHIQWSDSTGGPTLKRTDTGSPVVLSTAVANGWIRKDVFYYENGAYVKVTDNGNDSIPPFRAFWIKAQTPCSLILQIPY